MIEIHKENICRNGLDCWQLTNYLFTKDFPQQILNR